MATLAEIRTSVQANWPTNYHSSDLTSAKVDAFINKIQSKVCHTYNFTWMKQQVTRDTADDTRGYALPTAGDTDWTDAAADTVRRFKSEVSCELINSLNYHVPLTKRHKQDIEGDSRFVDTAANGQPSDYCIAEGNIELYDLPHSDANSGSAFTINFEFYGFLADLATTNFISLNCPEVLEYGATALGFRFGMDIEMAEYYEAKMTEALAEMINTDQIKEFGTIEVGLQPQEGQQIGD